MRLPPFRFSIIGLAALVAIAAGGVVILSRPTPTVLLSAFVFVSFVAAAWSRARGGSDVVAGVLAGLAAHVAFQAMELAYYSPVVLLDLPVRRALDLAAGPFIGAAIGGVAGLAVRLGGRLAGWPARPGVA